LTFAEDVMPQDKLFVLCKFPEELTFAEDVIPQNKLGFMIPNLISGALSDVQASEQSGD